MALSAEQFTAIQRIPASEEVANARNRTELKAVAADSVLETLQNAQAGAANGTAIDLKGYKSATLAVLGTFTGITANFEGTVDDTNWFSVGLLNAATNAVAATGTAAGLFKVPTDLTLSQIRARTTVATPTGSMTVQSRKHPR